MSTDKERLANLETHINYIKKAVDNIDRKVDDLTAFKFKIFGAASVIAGVVSYVTYIIVG